MLLCRAQCKITGAIYRTGGFMNKKRVGARATAVEFESYHRRQLSANR